MIQSSKSELQPLNIKMESYKHNIHGRGGLPPWDLQVDTDNKHSTFNEDYVVGDFLGSGSFASVYEGVRVKDHLSVAIKHLSKKLVCSWGFLDGHVVPLELKLLLDAQDIHGVVRVIDFYQRVDSFILVMEKIPCSMNLSEYISKVGIMDEDLVREIFSQILETLTDCHMRGIFHLDIRTENILIEPKTLKVTLIDFGIGAYIGDDESQVRDDILIQVQSIHNMEVQTVWSLGRLLLRMLFGDKSSLYKWKFKEALRPLYSYFMMSATCQEFLETLLQREESKIPSLHDLEHLDWMKEHRESTINRTVKKNKIKTWVIQTVSFSMSNMEVYLGLR